MSTRLGNVAAAVGKGLFAGVTGTAVMTVSSTLEMKLRDRPASSAPAKAAEKVLGVEPVDEAAEARFSNLVHWGYGTAWGASGVSSRRPASRGRRLPRPTSRRSGAASR